MTCDHEWVPRMKVNERGMRVFDTRPHFENQPNSRRRHLDVMYRVCDKCAQVGFRYAHSRVIYTWNRTRGSGWNECQSDDKSRFI